MFYQMLNSCHLTMYFIKFVLFCLSWYECFHPIPHNIVEFTEILVTYSNSRNVPVGREHDRG